jgi:Family of unknown function (DUF5985)
MLTFEAVIYLLCVFTSAVCAWLLVSAYLRRRQGLLLWSALCFSLLTLNNLLVFTDLIVLPQVDLSLARSLTALAAGIVMLGSFIWGME